MRHNQTQFNKLPKWAQYEINTLELEIKALKKEREEIKGESETNVFLEEGLDYRPLPKNSRISFKTEKGKASIYIQKDGSINVNTHSPFTTVILPRAANSFYIDFI